MQSNCLACLKLLNRVKYRSFKLDIVLYHISNITCLILLFIALKETVLLTPVSSYQNSKLFIKYFLHSRNDHSEITCNTHIATLAHSFIYIFQNVMIEQNDNIDRSDLNFS